MAKLYTNSVKLLPQSKSSTTNETKQGPSEQVISNILNYSKALKFYKSDNAAIAVMHN